MASIKSGFDFSAPSSRTARLVRDSETEVDVSGAGLDNDMVVRSLVAAGKLSLGAGAASAPVRFGGDIKPDKRSKTGTENCSPQMLRNPHVRREFAYIKCYGRVRYRSDIRDLINIQSIQQVKRQPAAGLDESRSASPVALFDRAGSASPVLGRI